METTLSLLPTLPIEVCGYDFKQGTTLKTNMRLRDSDWKTFEEFWNNLPVDEYLSDGGSYRLRRFGVFYLPPFTDKLEYAGNEPFFQDKALNKTNGGIARKFADLETKFAQNLLLHDLIRRDIIEIGINRNFALKINIHQIRILAGEQISGLPTPEGIHQDGHHYVAQHLISRKNVLGGESVIYDLKKTPVFKTVLASPLDTIFVNDTAVYHSVSPITCPSGQGHRDMLLIDFNFSKKEV